MDHASQLVRSSLVWDNHACQPLRVDTAFMPELERFRKAGVDMISLNVVFDYVPWTKGVQVLAAYRRWLKDHPDDYILVENTDDIRRARNSSRLAVAFDVEGMSALDERVELVSMYYDLGVRWMLVAYNKHNAAGGGCLETGDPGLSAFGRDVIGEMNRVGMVVCCSHTGERTTFDVLEASSAPVVLTHSNPLALCDHPRNVSDAVMKAVAGTGGVIGIVGYGRFLAGGRATGTNAAHHIDYVAQLAGPQHVGYSSDFVFDKAELAEFLDMFSQERPDVFTPGETSAMVPPEAWPEMVNELLRLGHSDEDVRGIIGENWLRIADEVWK